MGYYRAGFEVEGVELLRKFTDFIFQLTNAFKQSFYIRVIQPIMLRLPVKFEVDYLIIILYAINMMHLFRALKAAVKVLCHYKAMFINITILTSHRVIWIGREYLNFYISQFINLSTAFPVPMVCTRLITLLCSYLASARSTAFRLWIAIPKKLPAFLTAINTSVPDIKMVVGKPSFSSFYNISNVHDLSITQSGVN